MNLDRLRQDLGTGAPASGSTAAPDDVEDFDDPYALDDDEGTPSRRSS